MNELQMNLWTEEWMDGEMDGWMNERLEVQI